MGRVSTVEQKFRGVASVHNGDNEISSDRASGLSIFNKYITPHKAIRLTEDEFVVLQVGDHIEKINNETMKGKRHFDVAHVLRQIPVGQTYAVSYVFSVILPYCDNVHMN